MAEVPDNEFSDLDRTVRGPDGSIFRFIASPGSQSAGWALFRRRGGAVERVPVVHLVADGEDGMEPRLLLSEPATSRGDAERVIAGLAKQVEAGDFRG